ncbi:hypothetical protein Peur_070517 [Populus x canadensis]
MACITDEEARIAYERQWRSGYPVEWLLIGLAIFNLEKQMVCCLYYEVKNMVTVIQIIREELLYFI